MKKLLQLLTLLITLVLVALASGQTSGVLWLKSFSPGSADLNDPLLDKRALAFLDSLMQDPEIEVTFLGAADSLQWLLDGRHVNPRISEAWNDAKRLSRARALRERYGRGEIGLTHENVAGVKVVWRKRGADLYSEVDYLKAQNARLSQEILALKGRLSGTNGHNGKNGHNGTNGHSTPSVAEESRFNWRLQLGLWTWNAGSHGTLVSPSAALSIIIDQTSFILQGGVTPWHESTALGNQSDSFVYAGVKHMLSPNFGVSAGVFRGWKFFTSTDNWSFKTTGLAAGPVVRYKRLELQPAVTLSNISTLDKDGYWRPGMTLGVNFNLN